MTGRRILELDIVAPTDWINSNDRRVWQAKAKLTKLWREAGRTAALGHTPFAGTVHVVAKFWKPTKAHYDPNNLWPTVKAICDGLTDAGLWADDDHQHVIGPDMRHGGYGPARVIIHVEEVR